MLEAYFDDSGNGQKPVFILAGFMSTAERWASFNEEWQAVLDEKPELESFKMKHAMTGSGVWRDWSYDVRGALLAKFHSIIMRHAMVGFGCVIHQCAFDEVMRQVLESSMTMYHLAFLGIISATARYHRQEGMNEKVDFVFDEQIHEFPKALKAFLDIWQNEPCLRECVAGTPRSATDERVLPLQASDYLAWQLRRQFASMESPSVPARRLAIESEPSDAGDIPIRVDVWDRPRLTELRDDLLHDSNAALAAIDRPGEMREQLR